MRLGVRRLRGAPFPALVPGVLARFGSRQDFLRAVLASSNVPAARFPFYNHIRAIFTFYIVI